ncbi:hypothetical protein CLAFUW4_02196 [Fulvia fulva]|uniref:uncharacterized protein n=1 Tax=Passalora fulva TaxID=5499 RepID=UPI00285252DA|nr:uncharacterized protein CLAFUR5_20140 [Fulvia fulva]KAK4634686.1 hypothetical protein CLAFUR4_02191 [Fulvia fulva]KAK4637409.1 hypothetical protein CLAFUR0_02194 [Fulvia fulva]WMI38778.1 hypothetical protein CLAFUR5_20140 [Fulvia fulva]WPV09159.1 hypothetical protein CLAFUW4_02196 [Fulvia fulva]WPV23422.1 hypothetical protein CLAFUW7_02196 [Fulvia fulva]
MPAPKMFTAPRSAHLSEPGPDNGAFSTSEVRSKHEPTLSTSRLISLPKGRYKEPPNLAAGFSSLDISSERSIRANIVANEFSTETFQIAIETWGSSQLFEASVVWIEHKADAKDCVFGQLDTATATPWQPADPFARYSPHKSQDSLQQKHAKAFFFPKPFAEPPEVVCWLNRLDLSSGRDYDYKIRAFADEINKDSFLAHLNTWDSGRMHGAALCYVAFAKGKRNVESGRISTNDVRKRTNPRSTTTAVVNFKKRFEKPPTIIAAINMIDAAGNADLRIRLVISEVDEEGFRWSFETWDDSTLYAASAHWIALAATIPSKHQSTARLSP